MRILTLSKLVAATLALGLLAGEGDDGPYVRWRKGQAEVLRAADGKLDTLNRKAPFQLDLPGLAPRPLRLEAAPPRPAEAERPLPDRILAISDIHGRKDAMLAFLQHQGVVDATLRWTFGKGHLVIVGDVLDRGDQATECLWFLRALEPAARAAGGRVHLVLGNHEGMVLQGDLRYLHPKYPKLAAEVFHTDMTSLYGRDTELGRWLRSRPALLRLGPFLFVHGGIDPGSFPAPLDLPALNARIRLGLDLSRSQAKEDPLFGPRGPLWFRGLVPGAQPDAEATPEAVQALLKRNQLQALIIGHTTLSQVTPLYKGQVIAVDAGFKDGLPGEGWLWAEGRMWRGLADGTKLPLSGP